MTIREEFIEAGRKELGYTPSDGELWAAKWMAERCAKETDKLIDPTKLPQSLSNPMTVAGTAKIIGLGIRQLAKELT